jgi:argininosuccinate lyase
MAKKSKKAWGGRFSGKTSKEVEAFTSSIDVDKRFYKYDILGSVAHAKALYHAHVITAKECNRIVKGLNEILKGIESKKLKLRVEYEDVHMNVEKMLIDKIGALGKKLHTGRSRNDQVATDLRMYLKDGVVAMVGLLKQLQATIIGMAEENIGVIIPGYTHMQRAQPVLLSHHLMAYFEMFMRDRERLADAFRRIDVLPLGSGALAGSSFKIDRAAVAKELGFSRIARNSMDAVSDRDYVIEISAILSIVMMHLSRLCEELVIWSTYEFAFIELSDAYTTGSSIMPQKKNPDVPELVRGKTGRVYGSLMSLLTMMKGLPLTYNRDMQEDKEPIFDSLDSVKSCIHIISNMLKTIKVNKEALETTARKGFLTATELANYLVDKEVPFRQAHEIVGKIILYCLESNMQLDYLSVKEFKKFSDKFGVDITRVVSADHSVKAKDIPGGTSPTRVKEAIKKAKALLKG